MAVVWPFSISLRQRGLTSEPPPTPSFWDCKDSERSWSAASRKSEAALYLYIYDCKHLTATNTCCCQSMLQPSCTATGSTLLEVPDSHKSTLWKCHQHMLVPDCTSQSWKHPLDVPLGSIQLIATCIIWHQNVLTHTTTMLAQVARHKYIVCLHYMYDLKTRKHTFP